MNVSCYHLNLQYDNSEGFDGQALLENSDNDTALNLIEINKLGLPDVWGPS